MNTKWYGPWSGVFTLLKCVAVKKKKDSTNNMFYCWATFLFFYVLTRYGIIKIEILL